VTAWLRVALAAQLLFFAGWGGILLTSHRDAGIVWLATEPVDPRDLLSGHYVALRYSIASAIGPDCTPPADGDVPVWVQLAENGETITTDDGYAVVSDAIACQPWLPDAGTDVVWIAGKLDASGRIVYGIERMFVAEESPLRHSTSGTVVAKVALNDRFEPRLVGLVSKPVATKAPEGEPS
jgi:uncharacterized membrane-anchored protein